MSPELVANAFDKFKQEGSSRGRGTGGYEGIGIGLTLARGYLHQMNGEIELTSEPGNGTEVWMSFPIVAKVEAAKVTNTLLSKGSALLV